MEDSVIDFCPRVTLYTNKATIITMSKICFPHYMRGEFKSLAAAIKFIGAESYSTSRYALRDIVQYTPHYRSHLRSHGVEDLIERLVEEAPKLQDAPVLLYRLRHWAEEYPLADYDIRCYNIKDRVTILGHSFRGLKDVRSHIEAIWREGPETSSGPQMGEKRCADVHVGCHFERYSLWRPPYDDDARICESYIFRPHPISSEDMMGRLCTPHEMDYRIEWENLAVEWLPMLYYPGKGDYMFVATNREQER